MPRVPPPRPEPITGLTPELLAKRWPTENSARSYLISRRSSLKRLNCALVMAEEKNGGFCLLPLEADTPVVAEPTPPLLAEAEPPALISFADFEEFATAVDGLLEACQPPEDPAPDALVRGYYDDGLTPEQAVEAIVLDRRPGTPIVVADEPVEAFDPTPPLSAEDATKVPTPTERQPRVDSLGKELKPAKRGTVAKKLKAAADAANDPAPVVERPVVTQLLDEPSTGQVYLRFVQPFDLTDSIRGTAGRLARQAGIDIAIVDAATGEVRETFTSRKSAANGADPSKPRKQNTLPRILELLARDEGVSGVEIKEELGWDNTPGPWFFRHWTTRAKRDPHKDLIQIGKDPDGSYRYRLPPL
jgi:hypothetical protein